MARRVWCGVLDVGIVQSVPFGKAESILPHSGTAPSRFSFWARQPASAAFPSTPAPALGEEQNPGPASSRPGRYEADPAICGSIDSFGRCDLSNDRRKSGVIFRTKSLRTLKFQRNKNKSLAGIYQANPSEISFKACPKCLFPVNLLALHLSLKQSEASVLA